MNTSVQPVASRQAVLLATLMMGSVAAIAQDAPALPLWEVGVFVGGVSTPAYPGSESRTARVIPLPVFIYRGEVFRADEDGVGARLLRTDSFELDVGFAGSLPASSKDVTARFGMPNLGTLIEFGPRLNITLARPDPRSRVKLELPVRAVLEFNAGIRRTGLTFEPQITYESRNLGAGVDFSLAASVVFGDRQLNNYFYGVAPQFATAARPTFDSKAGLIASRLGMSLSRKINQDVSVFSILQLDNHAGAANQGSPLFLKSSGLSIGLGLAWTLGRSENKVSN